MIQHAARKHFLMSFVAIAAAMHPSALSSAAPEQKLFIRSQASPAIYHEGWIDLNKDGTKNPYEDPALPAESRIDDLLARMTLDEKTAQMVTLYGFARVLKDQLPTDAWASSFWKDGIGNIDEHMNGNRGAKGDLPEPDYVLPYSRHARALNEVQRFFVEKTRLGIPVDFTNEGIRGLVHPNATSFPAQLGVAATFNRDLVREIGKVTGAEARALGYTNVYSPILDLARDPRWGRTTETYGEDPFLVSELGVEQVRGIQEQRVVSTLKHFAVYSVPKGGRDGNARTDPQVTWREVQMVFLEPFRRAVRDAGALGIMSSYNDYNGVPIQANSLFLTDILRKEFGFKGYVVSDSAAVEDIHQKHRTAATPGDAVRQAVEAGLNIRTNFTPPEDYGRLLREEVRSGRLSTETIDARVRDILRVKFWLGLFDQPYVTDPSRADRVVRAPEHMAAAERAAHQSIVLLRNEGGALPLTKHLRRVLVTGPLADNPAGWRSRYGPQHLDFVTPLAAIRQKLGTGAEVVYRQGVPVTDERFPESDVYREPPSKAARKGIEAAVGAARDVDVIVAVLGEVEEISKESASRVSLNLPGNQQDLLEALQATGKPVVLVLSNGRPLTVNWAEKHVSAIVEMWFPGELGGTALADVLFGDYNPSGRLPITFPKSVGQVPFNFPAHPASQERDGGQVSGALYPFGHGLSYTTFTYSNLRVSPVRGAAGSTFTVSCDVTNSGPRAGEDVVQLYLRDDFTSVITFDQQLRGFKRVKLAPGETKRVEFELRPEHLMLYSRDGQWAIEPGRFTVSVGASSTDLRQQATFVVVGPDGTAPVEPSIPRPRSHLR